MKITEDRYLHKIAARYREARSDYYQSRNYIQSILDNDDYPTDEQKEDFEEIEEEYLYFRHIIEKYDTGAYKIKGGYMVIQQHADRKVPALYTNESFKKFEKVAGFIEQRNRIKGLKNLLE